MGACERVKLIEGVVADQVCPQAAMRGPHRVVDKNRHFVSLWANTPVHSLCGWVRHPVM